MTEAKQSRLFVPASELETRPYPRREDARFVCEMDGKPATALCEQCLKDLVGTMVESALERLIDDGKLDMVMQRVLDRRLARASVPPEHEDHELVDEYSGEIRD